MYLFSLVPTFTQAVPPSNRSAFSVLRSQCWTVVCYRSVLCHSVTVYGILLTCLLSSPSICPYAWTLPVLPVIQEGTAPGGSDGKRWAKLETHHTPTWTHHTPTTFYTHAGIGPTPRTHPHAPHPTTHPCLFLYFSASLYLAIGILVVIANNELTTDIPLTMVDNGAFSHLCTSASLLPIRSIANEAPVTMWPRQVIIIVCLSSLVSSYSVFGLSFSF